MTHHPTRPRTFAKPAPVPRKSSGLLTLHASSPIGSRRAIFLFTVTGAQPHHSLLFRLDSSPNELSISVDYPPKIQSDHVVVEKAATDFQRTRVTCLGLLGTQPTGSWWKLIEAHPQPTAGEQRELCKDVLHFDGHKNSPWATFVHVIRKEGEWSIVCDYINPPLPSAYGVLPDPMLFEHIRKALVDALDARQVAVNKHATIATLGNLLDVHDFLLAWLVARTEVHVI